MPYAFEPSSFAKTSTSGFSQTSTSTEPRLPKEIELDLIDMINLPNTHYVWFPVEHTNYNILYISFANLQTLLNAGKFIKDHTWVEQAHPSNNYRVLQRYFSPLGKRDIRKISCDELLPKLSLSPKTKTATFTPLEHRRDIPSSDEIWLPAERFFWDYPPANLGSSRHIIIQNIQLKGSGRNPMAVRPDQIHAWGGSYLWQNLKAICFSHLYKGALPLGLQEGLSVSLNEKEFLEQKTEPFSYNSTLIREARSFRLTQVMTGFDPYELNPKSEYQNFTKRQLEKKNIKFPDSYYFQYGSMLALGINHLNITKENVMLDGSLIDYEDVSYLGNRDTQGFEIKFFYEGILAEEDIDGKMDEFVLLTSNFHLYLNALEMTQKAYNRFFDSNLDYSLSSEMLKFIESFSENIYELDHHFLHILKILAPLNSLYRDGIPYYHLKGDKSVELTQLIRSFPHKKYSIEKIDNNKYVINCRLSFKRGVWKEKNLEKYYQKINLNSVNELAIPALKLAEIYTQNQHCLSLEETFSYSSQVNELFSKNSWILPYSYSSGDYHLKKDNLSKLEAEIKNKIDLEELSIESWIGEVIDDKSIVSKKLSSSELYDILKEKKAFVLQGVAVRASDLPLHFIPYTSYLSE